MRGSEEDDVLEGTLSWTQYYGEERANTFKCSPTGQHETVHDYNPAEGDQIVSAADCETVKGTTPPGPIQPVLTLNAIRNVPGGTEVTVTDKVAEVSDFGTTCENSRYIKVVFEPTDGDEDM